MDKKLDNFESFIKSSMDNHEASYSSEAWESTQDAMNNNPNGADGFESFVKESLVNHEVAYTSAAWKSFASLLNKAAVPFYKTKGFIAAVSAVIIAGVVLLSLPNETKKNTEIAVNDTAEVKVKSIIIEQNKTKELVDNNTVEEIKESISASEVNTNDVSNEVVLSNNNANNIVDNIKEIALNNDVSSVNEIKTDLTEIEGIIEDVNNVDNKDELSSTRTDFEKQYIVSFDAKMNFCEGETLTLTPREVDNDLSYQWLLNGKSISKEPIASIALNKVGENNIDLIAYLNGERVSSRTKIVNVNELPENSIIHEQDQYSVVNNHLFKASSDAESVLWDFGDGQTSNNLQANHTFRKQGNYTINYTLTNTYGCSATYSNLLTIKGYYNIGDAFMFTPDGNGTYDVFMPESLKQINRPFEMFVYDRSTRKVVFTSSNINTPWDGRDLDGNMCRKDAYPFTITITNELGITEMYSGSIIKAE